VFTHGLLFFSNVTNFKFSCNYHNLCLYFLFLKVTKNIAHSKWKMEKTCHAINCVFVQVGPSTKCFELNGHQSHTQKKLGPLRIWDYVMSELIIYYGLFKWGKHTFELDLTKGNRPFSIVVEKVIEHHCILTWSMFSTRKGYCLNKN